METQTKTIFSSQNMGKLLGAAALTFLGAFAVYHLLHDGLLPLAGMISAIVIFLVLILVKKSLTPYRWLAVGLVMAFLFTVFPILYTVFLSFTNMSSGHLVTKPQAVERILAQTYKPDHVPTYSWEAYQNTSGEWLLLVFDQDNKAFDVRPGSDLKPIEVPGDPPAAIDGYKLLDPVQKIQKLQALTEVEFGHGSNLITIQDPMTAAAVVPQYQYDEAQNTMTDKSTGLLYTNKGGTYTSSAGDVLIPGYMVGIGTNNYSRFLGNTGYLAPIGEIIIWNIGFSLFSVLISFAIGMAIAQLFENVPGSRLIRALLIIPYPIPVLVSIMIWRGLLNENMGLVTNLLQHIFGSAPHFFTDISWARFAIILINVYLSYPYFFVLATGALKSVPRDIYEAAEIDGASAWMSFRAITLPMVMRILMPLLIASFSFNFNNFTLIWGFNAGLPAMADTVVPMGHTDLMISFIYRLGFSTASAADYGFSAAITVVLFLLVGLMVFFQVRNAKSLKESR